MGYDDVACNSATQWVMHAFIERGNYTGQAPEDGARRFAAPVPKEGAGMRDERPWSETPPSYSLQRRRRAARRFFYAG